MTSLDGTDVVEPTEAWTMLPVVMLRQAGFPIDLLDALADPGAALETARLRDAEAKARRAAEETRRQWRERGAEPVGMAARLGMLAPLPATVAGAEPYRRAIDELVRIRAESDTAHEERLDRGRRAVVAAFRTDPTLREVLLLSNDAHYPRFARWLEETDGSGRKRSDRRMADLLCRYLQRVTTKNETTAHFGPISTGLPAPDRPGLHWADHKDVRRVGFFTHWAAQLLGATLADLPGLRGYVRPRRRPLAFAADGRIRVYAPTTKTGLLADWRFEQVADEDIGAAEARLLALSDGRRTLADLAREWEGDDLETVLTGLVDRDWLVATFEIPVGDPYPLRALRDALPLPADSADAGRAHELIDDFEGLLDQFVTAGHQDRPAVLQAMKDTFTTATGHSANRGEGRLYADRSVFFEECHSRAAELTFGPDVVELFSRELAPVYDLTLAGPRLRMRAEQRLLASWIDRRFGAQRPVPLAEFYEGYFAARTELAAECDEVDRAVADLDDEIVQTLLGDADLTAHEIWVAPERIERLLAGQPPGPPAVCNPDVMIAAASAGAIERGDYSVVVGECHSVRELLCHGSLAPLLAETAPDLAERAYAAYQGLLDDELLCDLVRSHPNKTGSQLRFPCLDLEITGRSAKSGRAVLNPGQLYVQVRDGRAELRAEGVSKRLRLLTAPAGGPSIRQDPLSPFAFPRHFGGVPLKARGLDHVPRIRFGRVVLRRESWRVPADRVYGGGARWGAGDAAQFHAVQAMRERLGMPRHVFAKLTTEPKPVYLDFDSPLLVRQVCKLLKGTAQTVEFSEMLPAPDQLWLAPDGRPRTSELRFAVFSPTTDDTKAIRS